MTPCMHALHAWISNNFMISFYARTLETKTTILIVDFDYL